LLFRLVWVLMKKAPPTNTLAMMRKMTIQTIIEVPSEEEEEDALFWETAAREGGKDSDQKSKQVGLYEK